VTLPPRICPTPTNSRRRAPRVLWMLVLAVVLAAVLPVGALHAASGIKVQENTASYVFSERIDFKLKAKADSRITNVILFYGQVGKPLVRRIYPDFNPGKSISASFSEELYAGQYAPGTEMQYYWQLSTEDGNTLRTSPKTFEYNDTNQKWIKISGEFVDLYYYANEKLAKELAVKANADASELAERYGTELHLHLKVYLYNSRNDMALAIASRSEGYDDAVTTLGVAVNETTLLLLGSHRDVRGTLAHELSHLVIGLATDNPFTALPRWLDEGLAMYAEGPLRSSNRTALEMGIRTDSLLSIRSMTSYSGLASEVDLFYGEAYSIVDFMINDLGEDKLHALLDVLAKGERQEVALSQVYGFGLDELDRRWRISIGAEPSSSLRMPLLAYLPSLADAF